MTSMQTQTQSCRYIIWDDDPGVDGLLAWVFLTKIALCDPCVKILGVTTVFGNTSVENATNNVLALQAIAGVRNQPVYVGATDPLKQKRRPFPVNIHGPYGAGPYQLSAGSFRSGQLRPEHQAAVDFICWAVRTYPRQVTIIATGPLTNIALAMQKEQQFCSLVGELVIMGSALLVRGNVTLESEANFYNDRLAAKIVTESCCPKKLVALDVTTNLTLFERDFGRFLACNPFGLGPLLFGATEYYMRFHENTYHARIVYMHDTMAVFAAFFPWMFQFYTCNVSVDKNGNATIVPGGHCSQVTTAVNSEDFWATFWRLLCCDC